MTRYNLVIDWAPGDELDNNQLYQLFRGKGCDINLAAEVDAELAKKDKEIARLKRIAHELVRYMISRGVSSEEWAQTLRAEIDVALDKEVPK